MHDIAGRRQGGPRKHEIDANGLLVTPVGLMYTHYDGQATSDLVLARLLGMA
jgi:N-acyl-D-aspartate/D-glutamate deacylase